MDKSKISIIAALAGKKRVIGKEGGLPWKIPGELKRFKEVTMGHPIVMGRKTFDSIGRLLPGRTNIIITRDPSYKVEGGLVVNSLDEALVKAKNELGGEEVFIIGGQQIFEQALPNADKLYLTVIENDLDGDVYFPDYSEFKKVTDVGGGEADTLKYTFLELERT